MSEKTVEKMAAQGDVLVRRVKSIPEDAVEQKSAGRIVVAHSETGHHHAIDFVDQSVVLFTTKDPLVSFLRVDAPHADIVHHRPWDTHGTLRLLKGDWEIRRQREHTPEGWQMVAD